MESQQPNAPLIQLGDLPGVLQTGLVQPAQKILLPTQEHPLEEEEPPDEEPPPPEELTQIILELQLEPVPP